MNVEAIDPKWAEATGIDLDKVKEAKVKELEGKEEKQMEKSKGNVENISVS